MRATDSETVQPIAIRRENRKNLNKSLKKLKSGGSIFDANPGSDLVAIQQPILCGLEIAPFDREYLDRLRATMLSTHARHSIGPQIWDRKAHNIFADPTDDLLALKSYALDAVSRMVGHSVLINAVEGRELVRRYGQEILPHTDRDEGDITAQFFLDGEDPSGMTPDALWGASNQFGPNVFSLCDPALHGSEKRLPWEGNYNVWLAPFRGLFILYPSRLPHYQRPYEGDGQFVQVLINMKVIS